MLRETAQSASSGQAGTLFAEEPVSLTTFVEDRAYLGNPALSAVQFEAVRHIERIYYKETYPVLAAEFEAAKQEGRLHVGGVSAWREKRFWSLPCQMTNFVSLQWGKGSLSPQCPIYNSRTGQWKPLSEWTEPDRVAAVYSHDGVVFGTEASSAFREGHGAMYRVRTKKGYEVDCWEGHRFLTWAKRYWPNGDRVPAWKLAKGAAWTRLWDMQVGDPIAVSRVVPEPTEPVEQPDRDVELAAFLIANGTTVQGHYGDFTCAAGATQTQQRASELFEMFPDTTVDSHLDTSGGSQRWRVIPRQNDTRHYSQAVRHFLERLGLQGCAARAKRIPPIFFSLPTRQVALLVSRFTDTDGWVSFSNTPEIGYSTTSRGLAEDVQRLWLRLGVLGELKEKKTTCQNCRRGDSDHESPHISYQVRVRDAQGLEQMASQLTLLDKEPARLQILDWVERRRGGKTHARHGDLTWDHIEEITYLGEGEYWTLSVDGPASLISAFGFINHNSGKDHVARIASMRIAYLLLCLRSPQEYYGIPAQDTIHLLNVASSSTQAQQAFFQPITRAVRRSWFASRAEPRQNVISFDMNVEMISGHSDAETQEGLNLLLGIADEIDAFKSSKEMVVWRGPGQRREPTKSAEGILNMLRTSGSTRFPEVYKNVRISYPRYLGSTIQRLTAEAKADVAANGIDSRHYVSGPLATWEVNPRVEGKHTFAADYAEDPVMARSKYECRPSRAINPYFRNHQAVDACFPPTRVMPLIVDYALEVSSGSHVWVPTYNFADDLFPVQGARYALHADLAVNHDRAGVAMAHVARYSEHETMAEDDDGTPHPIRELRPHVKVDFVITFEANYGVKPPREIQIRWARQLTYELIRRGFNIARFSSDAFESRDTLQILTARGIECLKVSTDTSEDPWKTLRDLMYEGRVTCLRPAGNDPEKLPPFLPRDELLSLSKISGHAKVDHAADGSKDAADALACAVYGAVALGGRESADHSRAYVGTTGITTGHLFALPIGTGPTGALWERTLPEGLRTAGRGHRPSR